jgi:cysteine-rich repeat protein
VSRWLAGLACTLGVAALAAAITVSHGTGCGGPACGNGKLDSGEECDDGNSRDDDHCTNSCAAIFQATVSWTLVGQEVPDFKENCSGVGAASIKLEMSGADTATEEVECSFFQLTLTGLSPGQYQVKGTLLDSLGEPLTMGNSVTGFTIASTDVQTTLNFPFADFVGSYNGNWFHRFKWDAVDTCAAAVPPLAMTRIRLERGGQAIMDTAGVAVDGLTPLACVDFTAGFASSINNLPWGPARAIITGLDSGGTPQFAETFDTFVGAGVANDPFEYDVNSLAPDGGPPDAAVPDAALPDAGGVDGG